MQQLTQKLKTGQIRIIEAPFPRLQSGSLLIKNHYSLISAGSEGSTIKTARKGIYRQGKRTAATSKTGYRYFKDAGDQANL